MPATAADDADFGGDLLETVQETQNDEEEQALTGSQVRSWPHQGCNIACGHYSMNNDTFASSSMGGSGVAHFGLECNRLLRSSPVS